MLESFKKFRINERKKNQIIGGEGTNETNVVSSSGIAGASAAVRVRGVNSLGN